MEPFLRVRFDALAAEAAANLAERAVHRCGGVQPALDRLRADPDGEGVWLSEFVDAVFAEHLLDTPDGAAFVLAALPRRPLPPDPGGTVAQVLGRLARRAFADLLAGQAAQALQRHALFAADDAPALPPDGTDVPGEGP